MKLTDVIVLDHLYFGFTKEEVSDLGKLSLALKGVDYQKVQSGNQSWEGVYAHANIGSYFEAVVNDGTSDKGLGMAFSAKKHQYTDVRLIRDQFPEINWQAGSRVFNKDTKWFDSLSVKTADTRSFYAWLMHYHFVHRMPSKIPTQSSIDRFKKISVTMNSSALEKIKLHIAWFPGVKNFSNEKVLLQIPDRDHGTFEVEIILEEEIKHSRFKSIEMQLRPGEKVSLPELKKFSVKKEDLSLTIAALG